MKHKGKLITFEGGDGSGKSTLIKKVFQYLEQKGCPVIETRAPGGTSIGQEIRELLLKTHTTQMSKRCELLLFLADRSQHIDEVIVPSLKSNQIVLCDRFNDSTLAYQGVARGFKDNLVQFLCSFACNDLQPDLTIYLDLDPVIGFERTHKTRSGKDRIESETLLFHQKIRKAFRKIVKQEPRRCLLIDASQSPEYVFQQAVKKIDALLQTSRK